MDRQTNGQADQMTDGRTDRQALSQRSMDVHISRKSAQRERERERERERVRERERLPIYS